MGGGKSSLRRVSFTISRMAAVRRSLLGLTIIITISPQIKKRMDGTRGHYSAPCSDGKPPGGRLAIFQTRKTPHPQNAAGRRMTPGPPLRSRPKAGAPAPTSDEQDKSQHCHDHDVEHSRQISALHAAANLTGHLQYPGGLPSGQPRKRILSVPPSLGPMRGGGMLPRLRVDVLGGSMRGGVCRRCCAADSPPARCGSGKRRR